MMAILVGDISMTTYTHHISGRLRTRYAQLKNNPALARNVTSALKRIDGVLAVEASTITGSLLIHYDAGKTGSDALLDTLYKSKRQLGLSQGTVPVPPAGASVSIGQSLADQAFGMVVEKLIERSAYALLAALI